MIIVFILIYGFSLWFYGKKVLKNSKTKKISMWILFLSSICAVLLLLDVKITSPLSYFGSIFY